MLFSFLYLAEFLSVLRSSGQILWSSNIMKEIKTLSNDKRKGWELVLLICSLKFYGCMFS